MEKIGLIVAYIFVVAIAVFILVSLFRMARSFYRYRRRMRNEAKQAQEQNVEQDDSEDDNADDDVF